jgi:hypothetical protein
MNINEAKMISRPNWKRTFEFFQRLAAFTTFGTIAQKCGKEMQTAEAWAREPESDENPFGSGKRNPLDTVLRLISMAHKHSPGLAREIADMFVDYVNYLDDLGGATSLRNGASVNELLAESAQEHLDIVKELLSSVNPDLDKVWTEFKQAQAALNKVGAALKEEMKIKMESYDGILETRTVGARVN